MKNTALNSFYTKLLHDVGVVDAGDGKLSYITGANDTKVAITLEGRRLALPTRDTLKSDIKQLTVFHPVSEQLMSGPSPVLDALREYIMLRLTTGATHICRAAMAISKDNKLQKKVRGAGNELMRSLVGVDQKMEDTLEKVLERIALTPADRRMYSIFLVASGSKENPRGLRTSKVSYPILDDAGNDDPEEFFGIKMPRKTKDKPAITGLLYAVLGVDPKTENPVDEYTSALRQAPYFHSLLTAFVHIAKHQNDLLDSLAKAYPDMTALKYNLDWLEEFEDFEAFAKTVGHVVPVLPGNRGKSLDASDVESEDGEVVEVKASSWRDLRESIESEPERDLKVELEPEPTRTKAGGWRDLAGASQSDRDRGISFGNRRERRRGGFSAMRDRDDYDDDRYGRGRWSRDRRYEDDRDRTSRVASRFGVRNNYSRR